MAESETRRRAGDWRDTEHGAMKRQSRNSVESSASQAKAMHAAEETESGKRGAALRREPLGERKLRIRAPSRCSPGQAFVHALGSLPVPNMAACRSKAKPPNSGTASVVSYVGGALYEMKFLALSPLQSRSRFPLFVTPHASRRHHL